MNTNETERGAAFVVDRPAHRYHRLLTTAAVQLEAARTASGASGPPFRLPDPDGPGWSKFFGATPLRYLRLGTYRSRVVDAIDLMGNPGTRTTKSPASELMVARAVGQARTTGRPLVIVTPTSGNKGTALRDAVARAQRLGIPGAELIRVVMVVPATSAAKPRWCVGDADPEFSRRNPVVVSDVGTGSEVKELVAKATGRIAGSTAAGGADYWYTLALDNYRLADTMRAFLEHDAVLAAGAGRPAQRRVHIHAVSSAFGLLGYQLGREVLEADPRSRPDLVPRPGYFLVQHLGAPDMVLHQLRRPEARVPAYTRSAPDGLFTQQADPHFPFETDDPDEDLDPTFYTRNPVTAPTMTELIANGGGGGIVVSKRECRNRFGEIRELFGDLLPLPEHADELSEWSLLMVTCGLLNAIDRGLLDAEHVVVHASGSYWDAVLPPFPAHLRRSLSTAEELIAVLEEVACGI